jgi:hypothetical protein
MQDDTPTTENFESPVSTAKAPPLLKDDKPVDPLATVTKLFLNVDSVTLKSVRAALFVYQCPSSSVGSTRTI